MEEFFLDTLPNGLRVVTVEMPHLHSAEVVCYVGVGSRFEAPERTGISHFLEHMVFRGTAEFADSLELERAFEAIGGAVNAAFANFTKALAGQGLIDDVNVNAIHPGPTRTERHLTLMEARGAAAGVSATEFEQRIIDRQGVRRLAEPEDVAALAAFLCRPEARHIQGTSISVDGGGTKGLF